MTAQIITTPSGERLVILPETEYESLLVAAEDTATVERFRRRFAADEEELIPSAIVDRILDGESRIRVWREHRGLTASALAEMAGLDPSDMVDIEGGTAEATVETLRRLASALNLSLDDLAG